MRAGKEGGIDARHISRDPPRLGQQVFGRDHTVDQPPALGRIGIEEVAGEAQFLRPADPDHPAEFLRQPPSRHDPDARMRIGEAGIAAGDQHIAGQRDFEPASNRDAIDRADHRLAAALDRLDRILVRAFGIGRPQRAFFRPQFLEVEPCGEGACARAGQDHRAHGVIGIERGHHRIKPVAQRLRQRVHRFGAVQRDGGDPVGNLGQDKVGHEGSLTNKLHLAIFPLLPFTASGARGD